jgi:hypothetical protein
MDKNGARGRAEKTVSSFLEGLLGIDGMMEGLLQKRYDDKDTVAAIKQAIQDIANEHAQQAELYRAVEQGTAARQLFAHNHMNRPLTLSIPGDDGDSTPPSVLCDGLYGPRIVTMYCIDAVAANKLFEALQAVIYVEAD